MSSQGMDLQKVLLSAGGAAGVCAVLYYLMKEDEQPKRSGDAPFKKSERGNLTVEQITKEQVQQMLEEIIKSQEQMKNYTKDLTKELLSKKLTFDQTYRRVGEVKPPDPLEKYGLSMTEFDQLLDKFADDRAVRDAIARIMGPPTADKNAPDKVKGISVEKIVDVHQFMLQELDNLVKEFQKMPDNNKYDMKTVTITAQVLVGSRIEEKFGLSSDDIESAVIMNHSALATNKQFENINKQIHRTMGKLMGGEEGGLPGGYPEA